MQANRGLMAIDCCIIQNLSQQSQDHAKNDPSMVSGLQDFLPKVVKFLPHQHTFNVKCQAEVVAVATEAVAAEKEAAAMVAAAAAKENIVKIQPVKAAAATNDNPICHTFVSDLFVFI